MFILKLSKLFLLIFIFNILMFQLLHLLSFFFYLWILIVSIYNKFFNTNSIFENFILISLKITNLQKNNGLS